MPDPTLPALSEDERSKIRKYMGYPQMQVVSTFVLGTPASIQTDFLIERAMDLVSPNQGLQRIREYLCKLDRVECSLEEALENAQLESVNGIKFNSRVLDAIDAQFDYWTQKLIDALAVPQGPNRFRGRGSGLSGTGLSVPVR